MADPQVQEQVPETPDTEQAPQAPQVDELEQVLRFDPFDVEPTQPLPDPETPPEPTSVVEAQPTEPAPPAGPTTEQFRQFETQLAELRGMLSARPVQPDPANESTPGEEDLGVPDYGFTLPDQLITMMTSGDPEQTRQALGAYAAGVARIVHQNVVRQFRTEMQESVPRAIQSTQAQRQQQEQWFQDFYDPETGYADLNRPELRSIVVNSAKQVLQANPQVQNMTPAQFRAHWPSLKKAIGDTARGVVARIRGGAPASPPPPQVPSPQATVPGGGAAGASPARAAGGDDIHSEMLRMFSP